MKKSNVGERLREERKRIGVSQADAGGLAGVTREQFSRYEGGAMPGGDVLVQLMSHGFDINYVLGGSRTFSEAALSEDETQLLGYFRATDNEGRQSVLRLARMECSRLAEPVDPYAVRPQTSSAVLLHDAPPSPTKKPPSK